MTLEKNNEKENSSSLLQNEQTVHGITYFPYFIGAVAMFFLAKTDKTKLLHHVKYSAILATIACLSLALFKGFPAALVNFAYIAFSVYLGFQAYNGEKVQIEVLDTLEEKVKEKLKKD